jgi:hypothetical protein
MSRYFGNYKPGVWAVYLNRDSTKRDSIWFDNFQTNRITDQYDCLSGDERSFDLHNTFLETTGKLRVTLGYNGSDVYTNVYKSYNALGEGYTLLYARNDSGSFYLESTVFSSSTNFALWPGNASSILPEVVKAGTLVFAPDLGLVQYSPLNTTDTFSLINFHLP